MDNKNVFIAIALSMSVLLFWAAFFETPRPINKDSTQQEQKNNNENVITPSINESLKVSKISRADSIKSSSRIKIENDSIIGSMSMLNFLILLKPRMDFTLKLDGQVLEAKLKFLQKNQIGKLMETTF